MLLLDLADACRKSGLDVIEVDGWRTRAATDNAGNRELTTLQTIIAHHTGTPDTVPGDYPTLATVRDGRSDLPPGPLAQLGLGRSGTVYVIAAGLCWHAGATFTEDTDNWHAIGVEAEHDGVSPWPADLVDAYARLCAALCGHYGLPAARVLGHKEIAAPAGRKTDPNFDMAAFRARVTAHMEDHMLTDVDVQQVVKALLDAEVDDGLSVRRALRRAGRTDVELAALVQTAVQTGIANAVIDVNVNIGTKPEV